MFAVVAAAVVVRVGVGVGWLLSGAVRVELAPDFYALVLGHSPGKVVALQHAFTWDRSMVDKLQLSDGHHPHILAEIVYDPRERQTYNSGPGAFDTACLPSARVALCVSKTSRLQRRCHSRSSSCLQTMPTMSSAKTLAGITAIAPVNLHFALLYW